jgi:ABC-type oligopeptide transport system ATPase subunit
VATVVNSSADFVTRPRLSNIIDNLAFGDFSGQPTFDDGKINIVDNGHSDKDYSKILPHTKRIYLELLHDNEGKYYFNNQQKIKTTFELKKDQKKRNYLQMVYKKDNRAIEFITPGYEIEIAGKNLDSKQIVIYSIKNVNENAILEINGEIIDLSEYNDEIFLLADELESLEFKQFVYNENLLKNFNPSFEDGLWEQDVWNCQTDKSDSNVEMRLTDDASEGRMAMELSSDPGTACLNKTFPISISKEKIYKLSFDYKNIVGRDVRMYYKFFGEKGASNQGYVAVEAFDAKDNNWNNYSTIISPEIVRNNYKAPITDNANKYSEFNIDNAIFKNGMNYSDKNDPIRDIRFMDLVFYAPAKKNEKVVDIYDNLRLNEFQFDTNLKIEKVADAFADLDISDGIKLDSERNEFKYGVHDNNLISDLNSSFEYGLWEKEVGNCQMNIEDSNIAMKLTEDASDRKYAMELSSNPGTACSYSTFTVPISNDKSYKLQFDYKNLSGKTLQYYYKLSNDYGRKQENSEIITVDDNQWHDYQKIITPEFNANRITIYFYARSNNSGSVVNIYDNLRLFEYEPKNLDAYYLYTEQKPDDYSNLKSVEYTSENFWKERAILHGVRESMLLIFPVRYSEAWKAYPVHVNTDTIKLLSTLNNYNVPDVELNRQAKISEVEAFISGKLITASGSKFISKNFDGLIQNENLPNGWFGETWGKRSILENTHYQVNNYSNAWWVDVDEICKDRELCVVNEDGSYDISLIIENKCNKWLHVGLLCSVSTLAGCLGYLGYDFAKRRKGYREEKRKRKECSGRISAQDEE